MFGLERTTIYSYSSMPTTTTAATTAPATTATATTATAATATITATTTATSDPTKSQSRRSLFPNPPRKFGAAPGQRPQSIFCKNEGVFLR